jgi:hypothetical protein
MEPVLPEVLINGAVVLFLWGLAWRANGQRLDRIEQRAAQGVEREYCRLQHRELRDDLNDLKTGQKEVMTALKEIEKKLARENNRDSRRPHLKGE